MDNKYFDYEVVNGVIKITHYKGIKADVHIPYEIDGKKVRIIGREAFYNCLNVTSIELPGTIRKIEESAFEGCINLEEVYTRDVKSEQVMMLRGKYEPESVYTPMLPSGIQNVSKKTFKDCWKLNKLIFPLSVASIESQAFSGCKNLENLFISDKQFTPDTLISIADNAFEMCPNVTFCIEKHDSYAKEYAKEKGISYDYIYLCNDRSEPRDGVYESSLLPLDERIENLKKITDEITRLKSNNAISLCLLEESKEYKEEIEENIKKNEAKIRRILSYYKM